MILHDSDAARSRSAAVRGSRSRSIETAAWMSSHRIRLEPALVIRPPALRLLRTQLARSQAGPRAHGGSARRRSVGNINTLQRLPGGLRPLTEPAILRHGSSQVWFKRSAGLEKWKKGSGPSSFSYPLRSG